MFTAYGRVFREQYCEPCKENIPIPVEDGFRDICPYCKTPFRQQSVEALF